MNRSFFRFMAWSALAALAVFAQSAGAVNILDSINNTAQAATAGWMTKALDYAKTLFFGLAGLEFAWSAIQLTLKKSELSDIAVSTLFKVMSLAFFAMVLTQAPTWVPAVMDSFKQAGVDVSGGGTPLTPSAIFVQGADLATKLIEVGMEVNGQQNGGVANTITSFGTNIGSYLLGAIVIGLSGLMVILAFAVIAVQMLVALIESYIVIGGGALMLGFMGSRWTEDFGRKYFGYAVSVGTKLFTLYLVTGLGSEVVTNLGNQLVQLAATPDGVKMGDWLATGGASLVYGAVGYMAPGVASTMLNGSPALGLANMGAAAGGMAGAPVAGALAAGAAGLQAAGMGAGLMNLMQTKKAAGGIGGSLPGGGSPVGGIGGGLPGGGSGFGGSLSGGRSGSGLPGSGGAPGGGSVGDFGSKPGSGSGLAGPDGKPIPGGSRADQSPVGRDLAGAELAKHGEDMKGADMSRTSQTSSGAGGSPGGGAGLLGPDGKPISGGGRADQGDGFQGGPRFQEEYIGNRQSDLGPGDFRQVADAQRQFDSDYAGKKGPTFADRLLGKARDMQYQADRRSPHLVHDGQSGSGLNIRMGHTD